MAAPYWFLGFDSLMEFIAFVIAMAVGFQARKSYTLIRERALLYLSSSFVLIGAGLLVESLAGLTVVLNQSRRGFLFLSGIGYTIDFFAQALAYCILIFAYLKQTREWGSQLTAAIPILFFEHNPFSELILLFLLAYIAAQTAINYSVSKTTNSLLVFSAFASLAVAHGLFLFFTIEPIFFPLAHIAQLFGFLLLLQMLLRVNKAQ